MKAIYAMAELIQMTKAEFGSSFLVQDDVGDSLNLAMSRDHDARQAETLLEDGVDDDEALYGAFHQQPRVFLDKVGFAAMARGEVEIALLDKKFLDARQYLGGIVVAEFGDENAHGKRLPLAQGTSVEAGAVIEPGRRFNDPVTGVLRNGAHTGERCSEPGRWWPAKD